MYKKVLPLGESKSASVKNYILCDLGNKETILDGCDRELALVVLRGQLFESDSCHSDLVEELEITFDDIDNDELLCASYYVGEKGDFVLIHEGFDFFPEDVKILENRFHTKVYIEGSNNIYLLDMNDFKI